MSTDEKIAMVFGGLLGFVVSMLAMAFINAHYDKLVYKELEELRSVAPCEYFVKSGYVPARCMAR